MRSLAHAEATSDLYYGASCRYNAAGIKWISDAVLKAAFDDPAHEHGTRFASDTEVYRLAFREISMFLIDSDEQSSSTIRAMSQKIDPEKGVKVIILPQGGVIAGFENADRSERFNF